MYFYNQEAPPEPRKYPHIDPYPSSGEIPL